MWSMCSSRRKDWKRDKGHARLPETQLTDDLLIQSLKRTDIKLIKVTK